MVKFVIVIASAYKIDLEILLRHVLGMIHTYVHGIYLSMQILQACAYTQHTTFF